MGCGFGSHGATTVVCEVTGSRYSRSAEGDKEGQPAERFEAQMHKEAGDLVGASLGNTPSGAVLFCVQEGGIIDRWNRQNPHRALKPGYIIEEVNGVKGYWNLLEVLRHPGPLVCKVATVPPESAGPNWFEEITTMARKIEQSSNKGPFMLRLQPQDPKTTDKSMFSTLPGVRASTVGVDLCSICLDEVEPSEMLVQLPCKHAFHALCAARWLAQTSSASGAKRQSCPVCCRKMVSTPGGGVCAVEPGCCAATG
jgi:hypothetical protein